MPSQSTQHQIMNPTFDDIRHQDAAFESDIEGLQRAAILSASAADMSLDPRDIRGNLFLSGVFNLAI